jgi:hypothetical protein
MEHNAPKIPWFAEESARNVAAMKAGAGPERSGVSVMRDIGEYKSPLDGSMITSRSQHRDHMQRHGVIEVGNERHVPASIDRRAERREMVGDIKRSIEQLRSRG